MNVRSKIDNIIVKLTNGLLTELELNDDTDLIVDALFDSITIIECVVEIELLFEIEFEDKFLSIDYIKNYKWLVDYIQEKVNEKEGIE